MLLINRQAVKRSQLTGAAAGVEVLRSFVGPDGDFEAVLFRDSVDGRFGVRQMMVEVAEDGEEIAPGDEIVEVLDCFRTASQDRAEARFDASIAAFA